MRFRASRISRRRFTKLLAGVPVGAMFFKGLNVLSAPSQVPEAKTSDAKPSVPGPNSWKITYQAHYGPKSWAGPIAITYVTGYTGGGSWRRTIGLRNVSARTVRSIGLGAHIFNQENPSVIVATAALPAIQFKKGLARGAAVDLDGKDELENIFRPFMRNGVLEGQYRLELFVREVVNDTAVWRYDAKLK
jgi:hypothetical protein